MPILHLANGSTLVELSQIQQELLQLDIQLDSYPWKKSPKLLKLLSNPLPGDAEKKEILRFYDPLFETLKSKHRYVTRYLLAFYSDASVSEFPVAPKSFDRYSYGEGYYVVDGEATFGFSGFWGKSLELILQAEEHLAVPSGIQYMFRSPNQRLKIIRYLPNPDPSSADYSVFHSTEVPFEF